MFLHSPRGPGKKQHAFVTLSPLTPSLERSNRQLNRVVLSYGVGDRLPHLSRSSSVLCVCVVLAEHKPSQSLFLWDILLSYRLNGSSNKEFLDSSCIPSAGATKIARSGNR